MLILNSNWKNPRLAECKRIVEQTVYENMTLQFRNKNAQIQVAQRVRMLIDGLRVLAGLSGDGSFYPSRPKGSRGSIFPEGI